MCKNKDFKIKVEDIAKLKDCHVKSHFRKFGEIETYKRLKELTEDNGEENKFRT